MTLIETSAGQTFQVREAGSDDLAHVWLGIEVKRTRDGFIPKKNAREMLVRKVGSRVIAN